MKRVRCPKCDAFITFDETKYVEGQSLVFVCPDCNKQFGIRIGVNKLRNVQREERPEEETSSDIEVIPLRMGLNTIGRYMKGSSINTPIETNDPSMDMLHCKIEVSRDKKGRLRYTLMDGPSNTGTFVDNELLGDNERRLLSDGSLFTIGATSVILRGKEQG